jgi:hypothetical protein
LRTKSFDTSLVCVNLPLSLSNRVKLGREAILTGIRFGLLAALFALVSIGPARADTLHWYRGNTHTHTVNSDGEAAADTVARWYKEHDYQFLFITDHEYLTDVAPLNALLGATDRFLVLPGQEITQWGEGPVLRSAHVNALFAKLVVWPVGVRKCVGRGCGAYASASMPLAETFRINIAAVLAEGAIAQINHPNLLWTVRPEDLRDVPDGTLIEVWNGQPFTNNLGGGDGTSDSRPAGEGYWDLLLSQGKIIWGVGSDDSHKEADRGHAWIVVRAAELTAQEIRGAISRGNFYASNGVTLTDIAIDEKSLSVTIESKEVVPGLPGSEPRFLTRFIGQGGAVLSEMAGTHPLYHFRRGETYVRASIMDSNGRRAWTQPVFRDGRSRFGTQ